MPSWLTALASLAPALIPAVVLGIAAIISIPSILRAQNDHRERMAVLQKEERAGAAQLAEITARVTQSLREEIDDYKAANDQLRIELQAQKKAHDADMRSVRAQMSRIEEENRQLRAENFDLNEWIIVLIKKLNEHSIEVPQRKRFLSAERGRPGSVPQ